MPHPVDKREGERALRHRPGLAHGTTIEAHEVRVLSVKSTGVDFAHSAGAESGIIGKLVKIFLHSVIPPQTLLRPRTCRVEKRAPRG